MSGSSRGVSNQGQLLALVSPKESFAQMQRGIKHSVFKKPELADNFNPSTKNSQLKALHLNEIYNSSSKVVLPRKMQNGIKEGLSSNFCLLGDSLYYSQGKKSAAKSIGSAIPSALKSGKTLSREPNLVSRAELGNKQNGSSDKDVHGSGYKSTSMISDKAFRQQDSVIEIKKGKIDNKQLIKLIQRVKKIIQKHKTSEQELINENRKLKEEISSLKKNFLTNFTPLIV
eukprot:TRINITY_DN17746_c0_g1_i2.p1 TRINITY_DN17746_c0_g1~~TRINITY_DN17746_c0_g1_i2.p1  ORF type:complete len:229 (-),score=26.05 TRINITY_DN17746_c0_g1_i2:109-795(-)